MQLHVFPESVFDASLHTAILIGLIVTWATTELLGWAFAGFVVAGYASVLALVAPTVLGVVLIEAILTWGFAWGLTEGLPAAGAYARVFGRERFLLYVLVSLPVRLLVTGVAMPRFEMEILGAGATDQALGLGWFSVGTVLVPLMANTFHKTGLVRGLGHLALQAGLTWVVLAGVLQPFTNFGVGTFARTLDAVATEPGASGRSVLLLVTTLFIAARANLRFGWDFGGILVPALLAMQLVTPVAILVTLLEVATVYALYSAVMSLPGLRSLDLEGPRRLVSIFTVTWAWKMGMAWTVSALDLGWPVESMYGAGYLLTSLIVTRCLKVRSVVKTLVPLLATSVMGGVASVPIAFALGRMPSMTQPEAPALGLPDAIEDALPFLALEVAHRPSIEDPGTRGSMRLPNGATVHRHDQSACAVEGPHGYGASAGELFVLRCGGDGPWLWVAAPAGEPDAAWLAGHLATRFPVAGVILSAVDPTRHPTRSSRAAAVRAASERSALFVAGDQPLWRIEADGRPGIVFEPTDALVAGTLLTDLGLPGVTLMPVASDAAAATLDARRKGDGVLHLDRSFVQRLRTAPLPEVQDERALDLLLPATTRALGLPKDTPAPPWLYELADRAGLEVVSELRDGRATWSIVRRAPHGAEVERWVFRPSGAPWTVMTADTVTFPGMRTVADWIGATLDARVTWIGTPREPLPPTDVETVRQERPRLARMARALLAPQPGEPPASRDLLVLEASRLDGGPVIVSSGDEGTPEITDAAWATVSRALAPWPGATRVPAGAPEAAWHPTMTTAISYQRALRPEGAAVLWFPRSTLREVQGAPERETWIAWWTERKVEVLASPVAYDTTLLDRAGPPCDWAEPWIAPPTEAGWLRVRETGAVRVYTDALRVLPRVEGCPAPASSAAPTPGGAP
jgi:hypothetical protein